MSIEEQQQILKIQPTREQLNRFIIQHTDWYCGGSNYRNEEFARQLTEMEKELAETGFITLTNDNHMVEHWQNLIMDNFVLDDDFEADKEMFS